jgi:uncharacterized membrane protein
MRVYVRRILLIALVVGFFALTTGLPLVLAFAPHAFPKVFSTKYYEFPNVSIDAYVQQDGSMQVVERRTYDFQKGDFHFAFRTIDHKQDGDIIRVGVSEGAARYQRYTGLPGGPPSPLAPGALNVDDGFDDLTATWYFDAHNEQRTFTIRYTVLCAVNVYPDGAHLFWQFVPAGFDKPTDHVHVTIHLPGHGQDGERPEQQCSPEHRAKPGASVPTTPLSPNEIRAWGHGPLQGNVSIPNPQTVVLDVRDLAPNRFVVGSVLFPIDVVPLQGFTPSGNGPDDSAGQVTSAAEVADQEARLASHANSIRTRNHVVSILWKTFLLLFVALLVGCPVIARRRDHVPGVPRTLQEPPEAIHPVDLAVLWGSWHHSALLVQNAYRAQLLWLAQEGTIEVRADGRVSDPNDIDVVLKDLPSHPLDQEFTEYLFEGASTGPVALSSLKGSAARADDLRTWWKAVRNKVSWQRAHKHRRWEARAMWWAMLFMLVFSIVAASILHAGSKGWLSVLFVFTAWAVARWFLPLRIRDPKLRERVDQWGAFRRFLKKFSSLPDAPALAVIIWEKYLVYATALGVARRVAKQVKALVPAQQLPAVWAGAPSGLSGFDMANSMSTAVPVSLGMVAAASSSGISWSGSSGSFSSSSGFSGGGFSGGGGGAGGGGGGGAG